MIFRLKRASLALLLILTTFSCALAQEKDKVVTLTVSGSGKTQDEAKQSALRSAIEQTFGAFISSKTEILNDKVVADQISSVASGNIQSFDVLNASQLPDGTWGVMLKAVVSVSKLSSFVQAKGIAVEFNGAVFAMNIKQQLLNEQGEFKSIVDLLMLLHEPMQTAYDYEIKTSESKASSIIDKEGKNWNIPIVVTATTNKNIDVCSEYLFKTLKAISLTREEVQTYAELKKLYFQYEITYKGQSKKIYLRTLASSLALTNFNYCIEGYIRSFKVVSDVETYGNGEIHFYKVAHPGSITLLASGQKAATFMWDDPKTLQQIEHISGYVVKPRGIHSLIKNGGVVIYEENGHGLVAAITDIDPAMKWDVAKKECDELGMGGYHDWRLPSVKELKLVYQNLGKDDIGGFNTITKKNSQHVAIGIPIMDANLVHLGYWSANNHTAIDFDNGESFKIRFDICNCSTRAVRSF
ncbi:hypothetical protein CJD36_020200 [Flavipsychrobacter stenotrophus]|uniref:DUF1566 domain-containing protein n=1 Tax=Flavipsychrobacter stenotrophus TaxID=2077091 RepID=A0A2S7SQD6_9BACT|nr:DUF1566 domain-containing protein [Flavipsychrobacter stenotrophus]PQJ09122.1 hypothetical protein CJD36_020200 [Flavipsychrobacter stenotrophus]